MAERAAAQALARLGVGDAKAADYLSDEQKQLRNRLRAHGRQLGDIKQSNGQQSTGKLVAEVAYEHWHRMLFARFLEQNQLLMYDQHTALTLAECNELVQEPDIARDEQEARCTSGWELAGVLASKMLPQIFRIDSPVFELELAPEHQRTLEQLVTGLALETFQAQDSLGWVYQFWQSKRKEEVNKSEVKIGADELSPVTQLFTEPYMVSFLLDNSLGAWWAGQRLSLSSKDSDWHKAQSEQTLRDQAAIPGVPLSYLRFVKDDATQQWQPASGTFDAWPKRLSDLKALDPCCGSGHFLVAAFLMLVPMRMTLENLDARTAIVRVLSENLHGLELDQRCVELAAFAVALEAWRYPGAGGYRTLPELHLACSGLPVSAKKDEWLALAGEDEDLCLALDILYEQFRDAPILGSLIQPELGLNKDSFFELDWSVVATTLTQALSGKESFDTNEMNVVAQGTAKAANLLVEKYQWIATNVPFKETKQLDLKLQKHIETHHHSGKANLATAFILRLKEMLANGGTLTAVTPHEWLFLKSYEKVRKELLMNATWNSLVDLGEHAFESPQASGAFTALISFTRNEPENNNLYFGINATKIKTPSNKSKTLLEVKPELYQQHQQLKNPDYRIGLFETSKTPLLLTYAGSYVGLQNGDAPRYLYQYWEVFEHKNQKTWKFFQLPCDLSRHFNGRDGMVRWEGSNGSLSTSSQARIQGVEAWEKKGVAIRQTRSLPATLYSGDKYDQSSAAIIPADDKHLAAIWTFCSSPNFHDEVRKIDKKKNVTNATLVKIPFDLEHWTKVAEQQYPNGLPQPYSNDPTQWIFHGHPCGSVVWDEEKKWTAQGELRVDDTVLQVAVARLLGYSWPAELDDDMELAQEMLHWLGESDKLLIHADDDGIVCLPAVRGEKAADIRLEALLQDAYGQAWTTPLKQRLLDTVGSKSLSLWLRDKFFEQHCKLFQHRPFIWHIWDGLKDGFSALVNYHKLDKAGLERLIYTYLGDWIRSQQSAMANGEDGADVRLAAAESLKKELEAILEGEAPYDIFVRWKPLAEQPIGWEPDLNDGVRLNIRPFMTAKDMGKKDAGILRAKPNIKWTKDRGSDVPSAPWYHLGLEYGGKEGDRINDHHLSMAGKKAAQNRA
ncbi:N-6 DNA methylase [uncultured Oceanisphaera sp.]|uniref:Eco57I restriction-modification methylase domain-containing protein n=1 Tax=uncultured Oceanisphaera sp. TaxID=353858 RepID=UPI0026059435|nr:N-6 DNA methylase [uncultured Oceanisphaera sp.]